VLDFSIDKNREENLIVLSKHKSSSKKPAITVHIPGNPSYADISGKDFELNKSDPYLFYRIYKETFFSLESLAINIELTYEADHHGPNIDNPILFYELGSTSLEWNNDELCLLMARSLKNALTSQEKPAAIATYFGGNHYCYMCNKLTLEKDYAFSHIIAKHSLETINFDIVKQAIEKTIKPIDFAMLENSLKKEQKEKIKAYLELLKFPYEII
jgi:D-aminoacyl-tRNA deacylase